MRRLTQAEQEERRRLGLCFNCDERYSRGHNKVCKRLFLLDSVEDEDEADEVEEEPNTKGATDSAVFSLHAVAGIYTNNSLLLRVSLGATSLVALVDTGSTHNFIGEAAAERTGLQPQPRPRLTATVANGDKIACPGVFRRAPICIDGIKFNVDLFVMPLAGYDMVLGMQWLARLGCIEWDVPGRSMAFQHQGQRVTWQGVSPRMAREPTRSPSTTTSWRACWVPSPMSSPNPQAFHHRVLVITPSSSSRTLHRWWSAHTGIRRPTKTSWSDSVPP